MLEILSYCAAHAQSKGYVIGLSVFYLFGERSEPHTNQV